MYIVTGAALTQFAKLLHLPNFWFGILAVAPFIGAVGQLPASYFIERFGHRKQFFVVLGLIHRLAWSGLAMIPWVVPEAWWWPALMLMVLGSYTAGNATNPAWVSWMADLVPAQIRGRYFSRRNQVAQIVGVCVTLLVGKVLDLSEGSGLELLMRACSVVLAVAGISGAVDYLSFLMVPDVTGPRADRSVGVWSLLKGPLKERHFRRFLLFNMSLLFSYAYVNQFAWLYLLDVVKLSNTQATLMIIVLPLSVMSVFYPLWGRVLDKVGRKPTLMASSLIFVVGGAAWAFVGRDHWALGYLGVLVGIAAWSGVDLSNFSLQLGMSTSRGGRRQGSSYIAVTNFAAALGALAGGLFAGLVAWRLRDWQVVIGGVLVTYHGVLFLVTAAMRLLSLFWVARLHDPNASTTTDAFRQLAIELGGDIGRLLRSPRRLLSALFSR